MVEMIPCIFWRFGLVWWESVRASVFCFAVVGFAGFENGIMNY